VGGVGRQVEGGWRVLWHLWPPAVAAVVVQQRSVIHLPRSTTL
jgi:hypothetical protein